MPTTDQRVDAYIAKAPPFAQPILTHLRAVVHDACPDVVETLKWGVPSFEYRGLLAGMAAFKAHAAFGFWKGDLVTGPTGKSAEGMWGFGRLTSVKDLPSKRILAGYVKKAMALNESDVKVERPRKHKPVALDQLPPDLLAALAKSAKARKVFEAFPPSAKRDYIEWVVTAKRPETRAARVATAIEWMAEGKRRNWKYERK